MLVHSVLFALFRGDCLVDQLRQRNRNIVADKPCGQAIVLRASHVHDGDRHARLCRDRHNARRRHHFQRGADHPQFVGLRGQPVRFLDRAVRQRFAEVDDVGFDQPIAWHIAAVWQLAMTVRIRLVVEIRHNVRRVNVELSVIPGITAANSGAAVLGAPLNHDFCTISLSDLLTPWDKIEKRLVAAAEGDFVIALYNPSSHKRKDYLMRACDILLREIEPERPCGYVENIGREGTSYTVCTLGELRSAQVNMFTTVFIGNEGTQIIDGKLVTRRGYQIE